MTRPGHTLPGVQSFDMITLLNDYLVATDQAEQADMAWLDETRADWGR